LQCWEYFFGSEVASRAEEYQGVRTRCGHLGLPSWHSTFDDSHGGLAPTAAPLICERVASAEAMAAPAASLGFAGLAEVALALAVRRGRLHLKVFCSRS
jgi:hypothetical protein